MAHKSRLLVHALLFVLLGSATGSAATLSLAWDANTETGIAGYRLWYGTQSGTYTTMIDVGNVTSRGVSGLAESSTFYFTVQAYNTAGHAGPMSMEVSGSTVLVPAPTVPSGPLPSNLALSVLTTVALNWAPSSYTTSYDVRFGTTNPPVLAASGQTATFFQPSTMAGGTTYFWQIVARGAGGTTPGPIWTFTTAGVPATPQTPLPVDGLTGVSTSVALSWAASQGATAYDIYLGTANPPALAASDLAAPSYQPGTLAPGTNYVWRIVAKGAGGTATGPVWTFSTASVANASAVFVRSDATRQGNWKGAYGRDGYLIANDGVSPPAYAVVADITALDHTWENPTSDMRGLEKAATSERLAATWFGDTVSVDANLIDGLTHQIGVYIVDYDSGGRAQRFEIRDAGTGAILDTRTASAFANGQYWSWDVKGHVIISATAVSGTNAVMGAIFLDPASSASTPSVKAKLTTPADGSVLTGSSADFAWRAGTASTQYWLYVGTSLGGFDVWNEDLGTDLARTVTGLPVNGARLYVRLWSRVWGYWYFTDYRLTAAGTARARLVSPSEGSPLAATSITFSWSAGTGSSQYWIYLGSTLGGMDLANRNLGTNLSAVVSNLPADRRAMYLRLWSLIGSTWIYNDYVFRAYDGGPGKGRLTTPIDGTQLVGSSTTLHWTGGASSTQNWLYVGTSRGGLTLWNQNVGTTTTTTVTGIPMNGRTIYVKLFSLVAGVWVFNEYEYFGAP